MNATVHLLESVVPASVKIEVEVPQSHPSVPLLGTNRHGSGVFFDPLGLILTANYVTLGARSITIHTVDQRSWTGQRLVQDFQTGLAIVGIEETARFPALPLQMSSEVQAGEEVLILAAREENSRRVNDGIVSAVEPFDAYWEYRLPRAIFTTAPNPGFGGGAVIGRRGEVRGIVLLDLGQIGRFTLAAPVDELIEHREEILRSRRLPHRKARGWLGLFCYSVQDHLVIAGVVPKSPAEMAGLKAGDVLLAVDGHVVHDRGHLYDELWQHAPGDRVELSVYRDRQVHRLIAQLGDAEQFFA